MTSQVAADLRTAAEFIEFAALEHLRLVLGDQDTRRASRIVESLWAASLTIDAAEVQS